MREQRLRISQTQEIPAWSVSVTKVLGEGQEKEGKKVLGWEYASPQQGYPYLVYLKDHGVFRTSAVQELRETENGVIIKTINSVYHIEYRSMGYFTDDPIE